MEYLALYNEQGSPTGERETRESVHARGLLHGSVHVWLFVGARVLLQKRSVAKYSHPGLWDISVAGHIPVGEVPQDTAIREIREEIGLDVSPERLIPFGRMVQFLESRAGTYLDREVAFVYLLAYQIEPGALQLRSGEVSEARLFERREIDVLLSLTGREDLLVPHEAGYYTGVFDEAARRAGGGPDNAPQTLRRFR